MSYKKELDFFQSLVILEFIWKAQGFGMKVRARTASLL